MDMLASKIGIDTERDVKGILNMLDEALDDYENGRLLTEEEFWKGIREEKLDI